MSNLSDLLPAGASGKTIEATATATIASKAPVILNSAGTVTEVGETNTSNSPSIPTGTATTSQTDSGETMRLVFDPFDNTRFLFVYKTDAGVPRSIIKLRVGTISGTTITLNTVTTVYGTTASSKPSVAFDPDNENVFVVTYQNESSLGYAKVGTISGSRGSESVAYGAATQLTTFALGGDNTLSSVNVQFVHGLAKTFILSFTNTSTSYPYAVVFTYSGTTITSGTETVLNSAAVDQQDENIAVNTETAGNFVASYVKADSYLYCKSGNISGTTITMDSNETKIYATFANSTVGGINWCNGTSDKFLWSSKGGTSSQRSIFGVGTLTGTTFTATTTIGEAGTGNTTAMSTSTSISDAGVGGSYGGHEFIATFKESNDNYLRAVPVNVVGTTVTVGTSVVMVSANHGYGGVTPFGGMSDSVEGTFAIVYRLQSDLTTGYIRLGDAGGDTSNTNLTAANFVGIADAAITSDATFVVTVGGGKFVIDGVSQDTVSLQEGATYTFDQAAGTNSTHPLRFSTTSDGTHGGGSEYTTGVTTNGTPGSAGAYTRIVVADSAPTLYYYCSAHSGMGGTANTPAFSATGTVVVQGGTVIEFGGIAAATGGTITTDGDYKVHTFTSSGTFEVTSVTNNPTFDILQIAGGGGGGRRRGGGGGAGGYLYETGVSISAGLYGVTVGAGGTGAPSGSGSSTNGGDSSIDSLLAVSVGGGGGGGDSHGASGGSGGGGQGMTAGINAGTATLGQGNAGIAGSNLSYGGGGGGSGGAGSTKDGGAGTANSITGSPVTRAGGGGAWDAGAAGSGGASAGGTGTSAASNATANTGSGGGGGGDDAAGGDGGSGVVIVRYKFQGDQGSFSTGSKYYVQNDGTITTVSSSVNAGLALSTTSLLLNGDS